MNIIVIGGGIVGLFNAYYLNKSGHEVTVIDENDITNSTSFGNAGVLSAFDKTPLSSPGVISSTIINILKGNSPLVIKPSLDINLYKWLYKFAKSSSVKNTNHTIELFEKYGKIATDAYLDLSKEIDFGFHNDGCLLAFIDKIKYNQKINTIQNNPNCEILSQDQIQDLLPFTNGSLAGVINLKRNSWLDPKRLMLSLKKLLEQRGVHFVLNEKIESFDIENKQVVGIKSENITFKADTYILSTGAKQKLFNQLGVSLLMVPAKGHSITCKVKLEYMPKMATMVYDIFTMITPREDTIRFTSKLALNDSSNNAQKKVIQQILSNIKSFSKEFELIDEQYWAGNRPLTPNDLPLIGRSEKFDNVVFATGLGWLGMTFSPAIGKIIDDLVTKKQENHENSDVMSFSGMF